MTEELEQAVRQFEELHQKDPLTSWLFLENNETVKTAATYLTIPALADHITTLKNFAENLVRTKRPTVNLLTLNEQLILFYNIVKDSPWGKEKPVPLSFINELIGRYNFFKLQKIDLAKYQDNTLKHNKHKILYTIFQDYEKTLGENNLDTIDILFEALSILNEDNPVQSAVIYRITPANPVLQDLLNTIRGYPDSEKTAPHPGITEYPSPEYSIEKPAGIETSTLGCRTAREEAETVLDKIASLLENGNKPSDILILHPGSAKTAEEIYQILPDFYQRSPGNEGTPNPISITPRTKYTLASLPSVQCVMAVLSAAENDFGLEDLETITGSEYFSSVHWTHTFEEDGKHFTLSLTPGLFAQLSVVANVHGKKAEWEKVAKKLTVTRTDETGTEHTTTWDYGRFDAFIKPYDKDGTQTTLLAELIAWIEKAAPGHIPSENKHPKKSYRTWASALKKWLDLAGWTKQRYGINDRAQKALLEYLDTISGPVSGKEEIKGTFPDFVRHIRHFVTRKEVGLPDDNPRECIRITRIRSAGGLSAKHVFIIGLTADVLPNIMRTLSPFTAEETHELCPDLKTNQMKQEQANFAAALHCATEQLYLSCSAYNGSKNTVPSSFLTQIDEIKDAGDVRITHSIRYDQITAGKILAEPKSGSCENLVGLTDEESVIQRANREVVPADDLGFSGYSPYFEDEELQAQFAAAFKTKDGGEKAISPTQLETYRECPYKWYLKYHLRLYDPGEAMSENSLKGTLIHQALERFFREFVKDNNLAEADPEKAYEELMTRVNEEFKTRYIDSPSWDAIKKGYIEEFDGRKNVFYKLINEVLIPQAKKGWKSGPELVEKELDTEIELDGRKMRINGKIDCVMQNGSDVCVIDYKTGTSFADGKSGKRTVKPEKMQIPLYLSAYCAQEKERHGVSLNPADGYYLLMKPEEFQCVRLVNEEENPEVYAEQFKRKMQEKLNEAFDAHDNMQSGMCMLPPECSDSFCPYYRFCRVERKGGNW